MDELLAGALKTWLMDLISRAGGKARVTVDLHVEVEVSKEETKCSVSGTSPKVTPLNG